MAGLRVKHIILSELNLLLELIRTTVIKYIENITFPARVL